jgi:hypothetical protein
MCRGRSRSANDHDNFHHLLITATQHVRGARGNHDHDGPATVLVSRSTAWLRFPGGRLFRANGCFTIQEITMNGIIYIVGLVVVVMFVAGLFGLR